jgi:hypothetical protein
VLPPVQRWAVWPVECAGVIKGFNEISKEFADEVT